MPGTFRSIVTITSGLKRVSLYVWAAGIMPRRKLMPRGRGGGPAGRPMGVLPVVALLRRAASRRRPAAPFKGDSPRASFRGCALSSASSRGRFGDFTAGKRFPRRGELVKAGDAKRCCSATICGGIADKGSSTDGIMEGMTGLICALCEMMGRTVVGSKFGPANRFEKRSS
jgi:hypothetical protein